MNEQDIEENSKNEKETGHEKGGQHERERAWRETNSPAGIRFQYGVIAFLLAVSVVLFYMAAHAPSQKPDWQLNHAPIAWPADPR